MVVRMSILLAAALIAHEHGPLDVHAFPPARMNNPLIPKVPGCRRLRIASYASSLPPSVDDDVSIENKNGTTNNNSNSSSRSNGREAQQSIRQTLFDQLENMRKQFTEMSESLRRAREREERARESVDTLKERQRSVELEKEAVLSDRKSAFVQEMTDISDELEGTQDNLRQTILKTRSEITDIQTQAKEAEGLLRTGIADLESRLNSLRREATDATKARDDAIKQTENEMEDINAASRREMREAKRNASAERKEIKRDNYAQETRIQQAQMDLLPAERERELVSRETPKVSDLQSALDTLKNKMGAQIAELKERRSANEMFYAASRKSTDKQLQDAIVDAKSEFENAQSIEVDTLQQTVSSYELKLERKEKELINKLRLSNERADRAVAEAIAKAKKNRIALYEEKFNAVRKQQNDNRIAIQEAQLTQQAVQERYDAELENAIVSLEEEKVKAKERLEEQEQYRQDQNRDMLAKIEELTVKMAQQIEVEKEEANEALRLLRINKSDELASSRARTNKALSDIQVTRSNLLLLQDMLRDLEVIDTEKRVILQGLEDERSSFRKQLKRTATVAIDKITLKDYRKRKAKRYEQ